MSDRCPRRDDHGCRRAVSRALAAAGKVTCVLTGCASAECAGSWKDARGVTHSGTEHVWFTSTPTRVSWEWDMDIRQSGRAGTTVG